VLERQSVLIEGAAALPVAALIAARDRWRGARIALVLSGSHIALPTLADVLRDG
jgi:threonine dehydratase